MNNQIINYIKSLSENEKVRHLLIENVGKILLKEDNIDLFIEKNREDINHINDWITSVVENNEELKKIRVLTIEALKNMADKYFEKKNNKIQTIELDIKHEKLITDLDDYYVVQMLTPQALDNESKVMQHCIGHGGYDEKLKNSDFLYLSLRDKYNNAHVTLEIKKNEIIQLQGKQNKVPETKYLDILFKWLNEKKYIIKYSKYGYYETKNILEHITQISLQKGIDFEYIFKNDKNDKILKIKSEKAKFYYKYKISELNRIHYYSEYKEISHVIYNNDKLTNFIENSFGNKRLSDIFEYQEMNKDLFLFLNKNLNINISDFQFEQYGFFLKNKEIISFEDYILEDNIDCIKNDSNENYDIVNALNYFAKKKIIFDIKKINNKFKIEDNDNLDLVLLKRKKDQKNIACISHNKRISKVFINIDEKENDFQLDLDFIKNYFKKFGKNNKNSLLFCDENIGIYLDKNKEIYINKYLKFEDLNSHEIFFEDEKYQFIKTDDFKTYSYYENILKNKKDIEKGYMNEIIIFDKDKEQPVLFFNMKKGCFYETQVNFTKEELKYCFDKINSLLYKNKLSMIIFGDNYFHVKGLNNSNFAGLINKNDEIIEIKNNYNRYSVNELEDNLEFDKNKIFEQGKYETYNEIKVLKINNFMEFYEKFDNRINSFDLYLNERDALKEKYKFENIYNKYNMYFSFIEKDFYILEYDNKIIKLKLDTEKKIIEGVYNEDIRKKIEYDEKIEYVFSKIKEIFPEYSIEDTKNIELQKMDVLYRKFKN